jgi:hypothetical protein
MVDDVYFVNFSFTSLQKIPRSPPRKHVQGDPEADMIVSMEENPKRKKPVKSFRIQPGLIASLNQWCEAQRPQVKPAAVIEFILEDFLKARGVWPITGQNEEPRTSPG